jgi:hypothetical protein
MKKELNKKKQYGFPDEAEIERVIKRVTQPGYRRINIGLRPDASEIDKAKYNICQSISKYKRINKLTPNELAKKIGLNKEKTEDILFGRIGGFNLDELASYTEKLNGHLELKVNINYDGEKAPARAN